jgi:hypothetical protein
VCDGLVTADDLRETQAAVLAAAHAKATEVVLGAAQAKASVLPGTPDSYDVLSAAAGTAWEYRSGADPLRHAAQAIAWEGLLTNGPSFGDGIERRFAKPASKDRPVKFQTRAKTGESLIVYERQRG